MIEVAAAVIISQDKVLLADRPADKPPAGWEFPGGKLEAGESAAEAAERELLEELSLPIEAFDIIHTLRQEQIILHFILCRIKGDSQPEAREGQHFKWVPISAEPPAGLLANDLDFWKILYRYKINHRGTSL